MLTWSEIKNRFRRRLPVYESDIGEQYYQWYESWRICSRCYRGWSDTSIMLANDMLIEIFIAYMEHTYALEDD